VAASRDTAGEAGESSGPLYFRALESASIMPDLKLVAAATDWVLSPGSLVSSLAAGDMIRFMAPMSAPSGAVTANFPIPSAYSVASVEVAFPLTKKSTGNATDSQARVTITLASPVPAGTNLTLRMQGLVNPVQPSSALILLSVWTLGSGGASLDLAPRATFPAINLGLILGVRATSEKPLLVRSHANALRVDFQLATPLLPTDLVDVLLPVGLRLDQPASSVLSSTVLVLVSKEGRRLVLKAALPCLALPCLAGGPEELLNITWSVSNVQCILSEPTYTEALMVEVRGAGGGVKHGQAASNPLAVFAGAVESAWWESGSVQSGTGGHTLTLGFSPYSSFGPGDVLRLTLPPAMSLFVPGISNVELHGDRGFLRITQAHANLVELVRPSGQPPLSRGAILITLTNVGLAEVPSDVRFLGGLAVELWGDGGKAPKDAAGAPGVGPTVFHARMGPHSHTRAHTHTHTHTRAYLSTQAKAWQLMRNRIAPT
jgi:hypothetical protein